MSPEAIKERCQYLIEKTLVESVQTKWNQGGKSHQLAERLGGLVRWQNSGIGLFDVGQSRLTHKA